MAREVQTITTITCDHCGKVTDNDYASGEIVKEVASPTGGVEPITYSYRVQVTDSARTNDLCKSCAGSALRLAAKEIDPPEEPVV